MRGFLRIQDLLCHKKRTWMMLAKSSWRLRGNLMKVRKNWSWLMKKGKRRFYRSQVAKRIFFLLKINLTKNFLLLCYLRDIVNWVVISRLSRKCQRSRLRFRRSFSRIWDKMTYSTQGAMLLIRLVYLMNKREMIGHSTFWLKRPWIRLLKIKGKSNI